MELEKKQGRVSYGAGSEVVMTEEGADRVRWYRQGQLRV